MTATRNAADVLEHRIGPTGELTLRVHSGEVLVRGTDEETVRVRDLDGRNLGERFVVDRADGRLEVQPRARVILDLGIGRRHRARLGVDVPRAATVSLDTANGDLRVAGLTGEQRYRTASGAVELRQAAGTIGLDVVSGSVVIEATGSVDLSGRLVSGDLAMRGGTLRSVALATTSGDLRLDAPLAGPGPYSIQTVSGDARIVAQGVQVHARTVTGAIDGDRVHRSESGPGRRHVVVGAGGPTVSFQSISGDLAIDPEPAAPGAAVSPVAPEPPAPEPRAEIGDPAPADEARLLVLRDLEAGTIDVATATARLGELEAGDDA